MKKSSLLIILLIIFSLSICGCGGDDSSKIKIGVIAELTGDVPAIGASCKNAAQMAVQEINDAGGIQLGEKKYQVKLIIEDNAGKADQSAAAAQKRGCGRAPDRGGDSRPGRIVPDEPIAGLPAASRGERQRQCRPA